MATKLRPHPRRQRHRVPRRHRQLHPRARARVPRVRAALHERAGDHRRGRSRTPRISTASSPAGTRRRGTYDTTDAGSTTGMEVHELGGERELGANGRAGRARRARRDARARRAARGGPDARAPALRLPDPEAALRALHARARRRGRAAARARSSSRSPRRCARTPAASARPRSSTRSAGRSTRSACRYIRTAAIVQLLLGNIGRPGGGIMALRGHASIQGSTDIPTLYNILPGYLPMPHVDDRTRRSRDFVERARRRRPAAGGTSDAYIVSLLKAWWGAAADARERLLLRLPAAHRRRPLAPTGRCSQMLDGKVQGLHRRRREPGRRLGERRAAPARRSRSSTGSSCATSSRSRPRRSGTTRPRSSRASCARGDRRPRSSSCRRPRTSRRTARSRTRSGCCSGTTRRSSRPATAARSSGSTTTSAGCIREQARRGRTIRTDRPVLDLTWDYPTTGAIARAERRGGARARSTAADADGRAALGATRELKADGSTTCGCWIYCGCFAGRRRTRPARRKPRWEQTLGRARVGLGVAGEPAHPLQPRLRRPRRASRGRSASATSGGTTEHERGRATTCPTSTTEKRPDYVPPDGAKAEDAIARRPPVHHAGRRPRLAVRPAGLVDGPLPTHYEPHESPFANPLYAQRANPRASSSATGATGTTRAAASPARTSTRTSFTTYRLTEHHTAGGMTPHAAVPRRAAAGDVLRGAARSSRAERGLEHGGWATIVTARTAIEARVLVTDRMRPLRGATGATVHQVGLPYHWGARGLTTGDAANDLLSHRARPERAHPGGQGATCDIRPGRRPRGAAPRAARRAGALTRSRDIGTEPARRRTASESQRAGRLLHRHERLHRLQGLRGRVQGVERRARGRARASPASRYDNTGELGANTWRHVAFVEQTQELACPRRRQRRTRSSSAG